MSYNFFLHNNELFCLNGNSESMCWLCLSCFALNIVIVKIYLISVEVIVLIKCTTVYCVQRIFSPTLL